MAGNPPVACLVTGKGPMFIYDATAIAIVLAQLPNTVPENLEGEAPTRNAFQPIVLMAFQQSPGASLPRRNRRLLHGYVVRMAPLKLVFPLQKKVQLAWLQQLPARALLLSIPCALWTHGQASLSLLLQWPIPGVMLPMKVLGLNGWDPLPQLARYRSG